MTWNVKHSTPTGDIVETVQALIRGHGLDVVCLQELAPLSVVPPRCSARRALAFATRWNLAFACHPHLFPGWIEGVAVLSRLPIVARRRTLLSSRRSYLQVAIRHEALSAVSIGAIHLSTPDRRARELRTALARSSCERCVMAGDFNLRLGDRAMDAATERYQPDGIPGVDHVLISHDLRFVDRGRVRAAASDHDPVIATVAAA
ncbi:MAG: endonuclease/exonuclease/phosphatase family protein [Solirubrobacteraceae bacterium]